MVLSCVGLSTAWATDEPKPVAAVVGPLHPRHLDVRYAEFPFGGDLEAVMKWVAKDTRARYADRIEGTLNQAERDRLETEAKSRARTVRNSLIKFQGQRTGYNISVLGGDFAHGTGESMLVAPIGHAQEHYFFVRGKAYKILRTDGRQPPFPVLLVNLTQQFGAPESVGYRQPATKNDPHAATWRDPTMVFDVEARPDYGTVALRWTDRTTSDALAQLRGGKLPPADAGTAELDPTIMDIMKD
jgi:hypothetical protein